MRVKAVFGCWADQAMRICVLLIRGKTVTGRRFSVGRWTAGGADEEFGWAVYNEKGAVVVIAPDAFEAARLWFDLDTDPTRVLPLMPIRLPSDAELAVQNSTPRRNPGAIAFLDLWLDHVRAGNAHHERKVS